MGKNMAGWVKFHRCLLSKALWKNHNLFRVFSWCVMKASWNEYEEIVGMTKVILTPGQFIFGRFKAAEELGLKPSTVVDCIKWLKSNNTIDIKPNNKFSVITLVNWELYQSDEEEPDTNSDTNSDTNATTTRQQPDTTKKVKKVKKVKKTLLSELPSDAVSLAEYLRDKIIEWKPDTKIPENLFGWANDLRLAIERDKRNPDDIAAVIKFATSDSFWRTNILSGDAVRRGFDRIQGKMMGAKK